MTNTATADFIHVFERGEDSARPPLLLLHGTGGDERDLLPLGRAVAPGASLLSPRGKVLEGAAPRFFRRLAEGVFDEADLTARTHELADSSRRRASVMACRRRSRSASRTAPTSPRACCCCDRRFWPAPRC